MRSVTAWATPGPKAPFERVTIERRDPAPHDVVIAIAYAGICHSDIHTAREEWGKITFPLVPGHEIAGIVEAVGSDVTKYAVGDRVGVGCMVDSCRECENCLIGEEQYCVPGNTGTYNSIDRYGQPTAGGYSSHIVVDEHFVVRIPDSLPLDIAAPLLCAGITLYSPLRHWEAGPGKRVAIVGFGGLGHMGVKIASALGADVTVLSQTDAKRDDGLAFGASEYLATRDLSALEPLEKSFDLILNTVSAPLPLDTYLSLLRLDGTMVNVGAPPEPMAVRFYNLMTNRRSLAGSGIGGMRETQEMLDFCGEHGIGASIETISADRIDEAYDRVVDSKVRYRFVIDTATL
ncbi:MAG TPA: NAD(P)-dependent alcohol dehydrogenase [Mycobacteriales bacterium]|nr:NAD(P)-dependent alcohol dehydrogenase [Mycobacteriales bacterium]